MDFEKIMAAIFNIGTDLIGTTKSSSSNNGKTNETMNNDVAKTPEVKCKPQVKIFVLTKYKQVTHIAQIVKENHVAVVRLGELSEKEKQETIHFISGFAYAFEFLPEYVDEQTIILDPQNRYKSMHTY